MAKGVGGGPHFQVDPGLLLEILEMMARGQIPTDSLVPIATPYHSAEEGAARGGRAGWLKSGEYNLYNRWTLSSVLG